MEDFNAVLVDFLLEQGFHLEEWSEPYCERLYRWGDRLVGSNDRQCGNRVGYYIDVNMIGDGFWQSFDDPDDAHRFPVYTDGYFDL